MSLMMSLRSIPSIWTTLLREVCPRTMLTADLDTRKAVGEQLDDRVVRFAPVGRRGYTDSDSPVLGDFNGVANGSGLNADVEVHWYGILATQSALFVKDGFQCFGGVIKHVVYVHLGVTPRHISPQLRLGLPGENRNLAIPQYSGPLFFP